MIPIKLNCPHITRSLFEGHINDNCVVGVKGILLDFARFNDRVNLVMSDVNSEILSALASVESCLASR